MNTETIYLKTCMIIFTYESNEYCYKIAEIYIDGQDKKIARLRCIIQALDLSPGYSD